MRRGLVVVVALTLFIGCSKKDEDVQAVTGTASATKTDETSVSMPTEAVAQNGIVVTELQPLSSLTTTSIGNATVVDLSDLVNAASQYAAAIAQREQAAARLQASAATLQRLRILNADDHNASDRAVQEAAASASTDQAAVHAADVSAVAAEVSARQKWGSVLADGFVRGVPWARQLAAHETLLVEAAFSADIAPPAQIRIAAASGRQMTARHLAAAPHVDARLQKPAQYYIASATDLPVGLVTTIHAPLPSGGGVFVPKDAVVWNGDHALVFVEDKPGHYVQHPISARTPVAGGFIEPALQPGQRVVITGAQQLLSEQHKPEAE